MKTTIASFIIALAVLHGCSTKTNESPVGPEELSSSAESDIKQVIQSTFDHVFSNLDTAAFDTYCTGDFLLLEDGMVMDADSVKRFLVGVIQPQLDQLRSQGRKVERINSFDFVKTTVSGNTAWVAYRNHASIVIDGNEVDRPHWLESAVLVNTSSGWKIQLLHSTVLKNESKKEPG